MKLQSSFKNLLDANIQDKVQIQLTEEGYKIFNQFFFRKYQTPAPKVDFYTLKLVELMQIFGPYLFEGKPAVFVNNEIKIIYNE